ncbi:MAG: DUF1311 domain-containing protein [Ferruginibacter sp.]
MRFLFLLIAGLLSFADTVQAQVEVTPAMQQKIKLDINKAAEGIKRKLEQEKENAVVVEFIIDTFKIERLMEECINLDYSTAGMRTAGYLAATAYDSLLNKYYKKLLAILKGDDRKVLILAQKAWIAFRDSEEKLTGIISKDEYSGGGTMQLLVESSAYLDLIKNRTIEIFSHYTRAAQIY